MGNRDVVLDIDDYSELVSIKTRVDVLKTVLSSDESSFIDKDKVYMILGIKEE